MNKFILTLSIACLLFGAGCSKPPEQAAKPSPTPRVLTEEEKKAEAAGQRRKPFAKPENTVHPVSEMTKPETTDSASSPSPSDSKPKP